MSTLMFWNRQNSANNPTENKNAKRSWLHNPESLLNGHVVYPVKFFGDMLVEYPKGTEVVKDAIRRIQFAHQAKKVETGYNIPSKKVEITISVDGVAIQERRTQNILYQFPLNHISYCTDEEGVKKFFSFIAKSRNKNDSSSDAKTGHQCFVFISSKLASDITLTIGQAFDLAYRRFIIKNTKTTELGKAQAHIKYLEGVVANYKLRLKEISDFVPKLDLEKLLVRFGVEDICEILQENNLNDCQSMQIANDKNENEELVTKHSNKSFCFKTAQNSQSQCMSTMETLKNIGYKTNELLLNSDSDSDFDPRADSYEKPYDGFFGLESSITFGQQLFTNNNSRSSESPQQNSSLLLAPPPRVTATRRASCANSEISSQDLFGSTPFNTENIESASSWFLFMLTVLFVHLILA